MYVHNVRSPTNLIVAEELHMISLFPRVPERYWVNYKILLALA